MKRVSAGTISTPAKRSQTRKGSSSVTKGNALKSGSRFNRMGALVSLGYLGFPNRCKIVHRYNENVSITLTAATYGFYQFSANGLYDPDITGTGHQPIYFDAMAAIYNHYTVIGSKMTVKVLSSGPTTGANVITYIDDDTTKDGAIPEFSSRNSISLNENSPPQTITSNWSAKATFGGNVYDNDDLQGTVTGNPVEQSYFTIAMDCPYPITQTFYFQVTIDFITVWDELKNQQAN